MSRIDELRELINKADQAYWVNSDPIMEDTEYDALVRELKELNPDDPLVTRLGSSIKASAVDQSIMPAKVKHETPLLSLDKVYSVDELMEWVDKVSRDKDEVFVVQPKYDGITCDIHHGIMSTRGDGVYGENITDKAPIIEAVTKGVVGDINQVIKAVNKRRIGELVISDQQFSDMNNSAIIEGMKPYKNQRNAVAGIVGVKDLKSLPSATRITFVEYGTTQVLVKASSIRKKWDGIVKKFDECVFPRDGIVVKLLDTKYSESLGSTAHHPRGQVAFKFANVRKKSKLVDIEWTVGKEAVVPTAVIMPVDIGGITICKATLHNAKNIIDNHIAIGDEVVIERSGDVIPWISSVMHNECNNVSIPDKCPRCGTKLDYDGTQLSCPNNQCVGKIIVKLDYGLKVLGVLGIGEATIAKAVTDLGVCNIGDWFDEIVYYGQEIFNGPTTDRLEARGFGKAVSAVMLDTAVKTLYSPTEVHKVLASLAIPDIGVNVAEKIMREFPNIDEIIEDDFIARELQNIPGIGPSRAARIQQFMNENRSWVKHYVKRFDRLLYPTKDEKRTICFTGTMPQPREQLHELARSIGWRTVDAVTQTLDTLVIPEVIHNSSKVTKAMKYGVNLMTYAEYMAMVEKFKN